MSYGTVSMVRIKSGLTTTDISDDDIQVLLNFSDAEVDATTGQSFKNATSVTDYYNIYPPKRADDLDPNRIVLKHYPVQAITLFTLINTDNSVYSTLDTLSAVEIAAGTWQSSDYYCDPTIGIIELNSKVFDYVPKRAKITYTYGFTTCPIIVSEISSNLAAIRALVKFMGGNYDRLNSYKIPEQEIDKGDFFGRANQVIQTLTASTEELFNQLIKKQRSQIYATSGGYF